MTIFNLVENKGEYISESTIINNRDSFERSRHITDNMTYAELNNYYKTIQEFEKYRLSSKKNNLIEKNVLEENALDENILKDLKPSILNGLRILLFTITTCIIFLFCFL